MKNNSLSVVRIIIFISGLLLIIGGGFVFRNWGEERPNAYIFSVICALLAYTALALPLVFSFLKDKFTAIVTAGAIYYRGAVLFAVVSVADIFLAMNVLSLGVSILIECAAAFILLIYLYLTLVTASHIGKTESSEKAVLSGVKELRSLAQELSVEASSLGEEHRDIKSRIEKISDNMRYLSPNSSPDASELEKKMSELLRTIRYDGFITNHGSRSKDNVESYLNDFEALYARRKNIL